MNIFRSKKIIIFTLLVLLLATNSLYKHTPKTFKQILGHSFNEINSIYLPSLPNSFSYEQHIIQEPYAVDSILRYLNSFKYKLSRRTEIASDTHPYPNKIGSIVLQNRSISIWGDVILIGVQFYDVLDGVIDENIISQYIE